MMMPRHLSRRTTLRGLGVAVGLPWLEAMIPRSSRAAPSVPRRLVFMFVPNGKIMPAWTPTATGSDFPLSPTLEPLRPFRKDIQVLGGLAHRNAEALGDGGGDHARAAACYLTGAHPRKGGADVRAGISIDQVCAQHVGGLTRLPSLEVTCELLRTAGNCDSGYACAYQACLSWSSEGSPLPAEFDPRALFERCFSAGSGRTQPGAIDRRSVLDFVRQDAARLNATLGLSDRRKMEEYLTAVREVEQRTVAQDGAPVSVPRGGRAPSAAPADDEQRIRLMADIITLALRADVTRVVTFSMGYEQSTRTFPKLGVTEGHHDLSHHMGDQTKVELLRKVDRYYVQQLAYFLGRLRQAREGEGTLLDASLVAYGAALSDGNRHLHDDLPTVLAGRGGGTLSPGSHVRFPQGTPMCNLWLSLAQRMGSSIERFGDSTGVVAGIG
jgi:hypothetical protein